MRAAIAGCLAIVMAAFVGCSSAPATPQLDPRALARGTVETLETVWVDSAKACMAVANGTQSQETADSCKQYLQPSREALLAAADAVDSWTAADQKNFPCLIASAVDGINNVKSLVVLAGPPPQVVADGLQLANMFVPQCKPADGGK